MIELKKLDEIIGFYNSNLVLLAGRPGVGVSTLAINLTGNIVKKNIGTVLFFSLELSKTSCLKKLNVDDIENLIIDDTPAITIEEIIERCKSTKDLELIAIDYEALIATKKDLQGIEKINYIRKKLKDLAKELDVPIVVANILNRAPDARFKAGLDPRPRLDDFETDISGYDTVLLLYRENYYNKNSTNNILEIIVARNKNRKLGTIEI